jgi:Motility quorum-sensing regulator, toxin of MqsA
MTSYANAQLWQDVYRLTVGGKKLYMKFTLDSENNLFMISFKEA